MQKNSKKTHTFFIKSLTCTHTKYLMSVSYTKKGNQAYGIGMQNDS